MHVETNTSATWPSWWTQSGRLPSGDGQKRLRTGTQCHDRRQGDDPPCRELFGADTVRAIIANAAQRDRKIIFGTAFEIDDPELSRRIIEFIERITDILKEQKTT